MIERIDRVQRRHPVLGMPLAVVYKFFEDAGMHLVATLAYYALVATFPVAVLMGGACALLIGIDPDLQGPLSRSLLGTVPVVRGAIASGSATATGWALVLVVFGALYGGLGVAGAFQHAMNQVWAVPRNARPNPVLTRARSVVILALLLASVIGSSILAGLGGPGSTSLVGRLGPVALFAFNIVLFVVAMRYATAAPVPLRAILPGAVVGGVLWPIFQATSMEQLAAADTGTARGVALAMLGLVALMHLGALVVVFCAELNVVLHRRLYPRALLTPFTDRVDLTDADRVSYAAQAGAQRFKAYQHISVEFGAPDGFGVPAPSGGGPHSETDPRA